MNHSMLDHIVFFPRQWIAEVLTQCRALRGLLYILRTQGGLNPRYTKIDDNPDLTVENLIRIEVNKAMIQDYEDFMKQWNKLGKMIYTFGDEYGDEFNKQ